MVIKYWDQKRYLTDSKKKKKKKKPKIGQGVASAYSDQDLRSLLERVCRALKQSTFWNNLWAGWSMSSCPRSKFLFCGSRIHLLVNPMHIDTLTITVRTSKKKSTLSQMGKGQIQINVRICVVWQGSILFIVQTYKAWHSFYTILAVLLFWVACTADQAVSNLYEQNEIRFVSQFKFLVTSKGWTIIWSVGEYAPGRYHWNRYG